MRHYADISKRRILFLPDSNMTRCFSRENLKYSAQFLLLSIYHFRCQLLPPSWYRYWNFMILIMRARNALTFLLRLHWSISRALLMTAPIRNALLNSIGQVHKRGLTAFSRNIPDRWHDYMKRNGAWAYRRFEVIHFYRQIKSSTRWQTSE